MNLLPGKARDSMQSPTRVSNWCNNTAHPSLSCSAREVWKKMKEVAACPMERGLDSLSPLSLHGQLPLAQRSWKVFSSSWSLLVAVILQAVEQEETFIQQTAQVFTRSHQTPPAEANTSLSANVGLIVGCILQPTLSSLTEAISPSLIFPGWSV